MLFNNKNIYHWICIFFFLSYFTIQFKNKIVNILLIYKNILSNEIDQFAPMMRETIKNDNL